MKIPLQVKSHICKITFAFALATCLATIPGIICVTETKTIFLEKCIAALRAGDLSIRRLNSLRPSQHFDQLEQIFNAIKAPVETIPGPAYRPETHIFDDSEKLCVLETLHLANKAFHAVLHTIPSKVNSHDIQKYTEIIYLMMDNPSRKLQSEEFEILRQDAIELLEYFLTGGFYFLK